MNRDRSWHVRLEKPRVLPTIDIQVEPDVGEIFQFDATTALGNVRFGLMDSTIHTILQTVQLDADEVPIFVTGNVFADALATTTPTPSRTRTARPRFARSCTRAGSTGRWSATCWPTSAPSTTNSPSGSTIRS